MYEQRSQPLISNRLFLRRLAGSTSFGVAFVAASLLIGMAGYHFLEGLSPIDSFLNASMILGGMGPVEQPQTYSGKLFAGLYALYCGLAVILAAGIIFAPVVHRLMHKFHHDMSNDADLGASQSPKPRRVSSHQGSKNRP